MSKPTSGWKDDDPPLRPPQAPEGEPIPAQSTPDTGEYRDPGPGGPLQQIFPTEAEHGGVGDQAPIYETAMEPVPSDHVDLGVDDSPFTGSADTGQPPSADGEYQTTYQLKQGLFGERLAVESLAADGHAILLCKREIQGTNQPGFDLVTVKDGVVYFVDNKAFTTERNISSVSSLTTNFDKNLQNAVTELRGHAEATSTDPKFRFIHDAYTEALELIDHGDYQKATTGYALANEGRHATKVTEALQGEGIEHIPLRTQGVPTIHPVFSDPGSITGPPPSPTTPPAVHVSPLHPGGSFGPKT